MAAQTEPVTATETKAAPAADSVLRYIGIRAEYTGMKGSHKEITLAQFREAGIQKPFTNESQSFVSWNPQNGYEVPKSVFTSAAYKRLLLEDDLEEASAE